MDENRFEGTARNLGGKVQEGVGRAAFKTTTEGLVNQAAGTAQDLYGQTADAARQTATTLATQCHRNSALHHRGRGARNRLAAR